MPFMKEAFPYRSCYADLLELPLPFGEYQFFRGSRGGRGWTKIAGNRGIQKTDTTSLDSPNIGIAQMHASSYPVFASYFQQSLQKFAGLSWLGRLSRPPVDPRGRVISIS